MTPEIERKLQEMLKELTKRLGKSDFDRPIAPAFHSKLGEKLISDYAKTDKQLSQAKRLLEEAKALMEEGEQSLKDIYRDVREENTAAWEECLDQFSEGQWVKLKSGDFAQIVDKDPIYGDVGVLISDSKKQPWTPPVDRKVQWRPFTDLILGTEEEEIQEVMAQEEEAQELHDATTGQPCPQPPCSTCGHSYCFRYDWKDLSSMGGWEMICCSPTCECYHCTRARKQTDTCDYWACCQCFGRGR